MRSGYDEAMKKSFILAFIGSGLPLIAYPFVAMASLMSLAAEAPSSAETLLLIISSAFLWGSLLYPLIYILSVITFFIVKSEKKKKLCAFIPYAHLGLVFLLFLSWIVVEG